MLSPDALLAELAFLAFPPDLTSLLLAATGEVRRDGALLDNYRATEQALLAGEPLPTPAHRFTELLVALGQLPTARARHRELGIAEATSCDSFNDLLRLSKAHHQRTGEWGFTSLSWVKWHLRSELFELGRLQFQLATFPFPYRVYRHTETGAVTAFANAGLSVNASGLPFLPERATGNTGNTGNAGTADAIVTVLEENGETITGHAVNLACGTVERTPTTLPLKGYEQALQQDDRTLAVHIAVGQRLDPAACDASFQEALQFFPRTFPDYPWRAFRCISWLLDPALEEIAKPGENIGLFGRRFHRVPTAHSNGDQIIERTFGEGVDPLTATPSNSLQARIIDHLRAGKQFRTTAGFILREV